MARFRLLLGAAAAASCMLATTSPARAVVSCGMNVTTSITFTEDLACASPALIVETNGVTIDLDGFTLAASTPGGGTGILVEDVDDGLDLTDVTIRDGTIAGFETAVSILGTGPTERVVRPHIQSVRMEGCGGAGGPFTGCLEVVSALDLRVEDGEVVSTTGRGLVLEIGVENAVIEDNEIQAVAGGISFLGFSSGIVQRNQVHGGGTGIGIGDDEVDLQILDNEIFDNLSGIGTDQATPSLIRGNQIRNNTFGIALGQAFGFQIEQNEITGNGIGLFFEEPCEAPVVDGNRFEENRIGLQIGSCFNDGVIENNVFSRNGAAGILAVADLTGAEDLATIRDNLFRSNGFSPAGTTNHLGQPVNDGLHVESSPEAFARVVTGNSAVANADLGIEAPGVTDGGGNVAGSNGNVAQCVGVACGLPATVTSHQIVNCDTQTEIATVPNGSFFQIFDLASVGNPSCLGIGVHMDANTTFGDGSVGHGYTPAVGETVTTPYEGENLEPFAYLGDSGWAVPDAIAACHCSFPGRGDLTAPGIHQLTSMPCSANTVSWTAGDKTEQCMASGGQAGALYSTALVIPEPAVLLQLPFGLGLVAVLFQARRRAKAGARRSGLG